MIRFSRFTKNFIVLFFILIALDFIFNTEFYIRRSAKEDVKPVLNNTLISTQKESRTSTLAPMLINRMEMYSSFKNRKVNKPSRNSNDLGEINPGASFQ